MNDEADNLFIRKLNTNTNRHEMNNKNATSIQATRYIEENRIFFREKGQKKS